MRLEEKAESRSKQNLLAYEPSKKASKKEREIKLNLKMKELIERALISQNNMIKQFTEEVVDVQRFYSTLKKSEISAEKCNNFWKLNPFIHENNLDSKLIYGTFSRDVLNMKKEGEEIIRDFHSRNIRKLENSQRFSKIDFEDEKMIHSSPQPLCLLRKISKEPIKIKICNHHFSKILNRTRESLMDQNFSQIIGEFTHGFYKELIKRKDGTQKKRLFLSFKISEKIFKIFPTDLKILRKRDEILILLRINLRYVFRPQGEIIVDEKGKIYGYSAGIMSVLNLKNLKKSVKKFENLEDISEDFKNFNFFSNEKFQVKFQKKKNLTVEPRVLSDSQLKCLRLFEAQNKSLEIENCLNKTMTLKQAEIENEKKIHEIFRNYDINEQNGNFFSFMINENLQIEGRFHQIEKKEDSLKFDNITTTGQIPKENLMSLKAKYLQKKSVEKINYAEGVQTKRLIDGYIRDFNDTENDEFSDEEEIREIAQNTKRFSSKIQIENIKKKNEILSKKDPQRRNLLQASYDDILNSFETKLKKIKEKFGINLLKFTKPQKIVLTLSFISTLALVIHQAFVDITFSSSYNRIKLLNEVSNTAGIRNAAVIGITLKLQDLIWANQGFDFTHAYDKNWSIDEYKRECMNYIEFYFNDYKKYQNKLIDIYGKFHDQKTIQKIEEEEYITLITGNKQAHYKFWDSQNILYAATARVLGYQPNDITLENKDVDFLYRNLLEAFLVRFPKVNNIRFAEIDSLMEESSISYRSNLIILSILSLVLLVILLVGIRRVLQEIEDHIQIFLGFNKKNFSKKIKENLKFIQKIRDSMIHEETFLGDIKEEKQQKRRETFQKDDLHHGYFRTRKRSKGSIVPCFGVLKKSYERSINLIKKGIGYSISFRTILVSDSVIHLLQVFSQMKLYEEKFIFHKNPVQKYIDRFIPYSQQLNNTLNYNLDDDLRRSYKKYFMSDICEFFDEIQLPVYQHEINCETFLNGWNKHSFYQSLTEYFDKTMGLFEDMDYLYANKNLEKFPFDDECDPKFKSLVNGTKKFTWCLLTKLYHQYIHKPVTLKMNEAGKKAVTKKIAEGVDLLWENFTLTVIRFLFWNTFFWFAVSGIRRVIFYQNNEELLKNREFSKYFMNMN